MLRLAARRCAAARPVQQPSLVLRRFASSRVVVCGDEDAYTAATASDAGAVVYFTASWCGPCKMISPFFDELADANATGATFIKVDVDDMPDVAAAAMVSRARTA